MILKSALIFVFALITATSLQAQPSTGEFYAFRLLPGDDLRQGILKVAADQKLKAGAIVTCVGSLSKVNLRFANQETGEAFDGYHEIVSLVGTFSDSSSHLHLSVSDRTGNTIGGHLLDGNIIYTTAEIVIVDLKDVAFHREVDSTYGYRELVIRKRTKP